MGPMAQRWTPVVGVALACLGLAAGMLIAADHLPKVRETFATRTPAPSFDTAAASDRDPEPNPDPDPDTADEERADRATSGPGSRPTAAARTAVTIPPHADTPPAHGPQPRTLIRPAVDHTTPTPTGATTSSAPATPTGPESAAPTPSQPSPTPTTPVAAPVDRIPPSAVSELRVLETTATEYVIGWRAALDNVGVAGYEVRLNGVREFITDTGLTVPIGAELRKLHVEVRAYDAAGNIGPPADLWIEPIAPDELGSPSMDPNAPIDASPESASRTSGS